MSGAVNGVEPCQHGNYGRAAASVVTEVFVGAVVDVVTCGHGSAVDCAVLANDTHTNATRTEYQGRGRPRDSDRNSNGYHN